MFVTFTDILRMCCISGVIGMIIGAAIVGVVIEVFGGKR
jgi:hypothetical protein